MRKVVILLGPPGSGKGSQAFMIREAFGLAHISTGDLLREEIRQGNALGLEAKGYMDKGTFPPDELIIKVLMHGLEKPECAPGFILDGVPRTINQAEILDKNFGENDKRIVINLKLPTKVIIDRITGRRVCSQCGAPYHVEFSPSKSKGVCDLCGGRLIQRPDDTEEVAKTRFEFFENQTAPIIDFYRKQELVTDIDCDGLSKDEVFKLIELALTS
ncbi:MAG: nucleoside monophosphate kinase [Simkaniaceae bacterium]|nr:nucleoside monophosphate kinase [Simkaniaceae bacterium]